MGANSSPSQAPLHWCVPARRAVVTGDLTYEDAITAWIADLRRHQAPLIRWYLPPPEGGRSDPLPATVQSRLDAAAVGRFASGLAAIEEWRNRFFSDAEAGAEAAGTAVQVSPELGNTVDTASAAFLVRLWKGPWRVLRDWEVANRTTQRRCPPAPTVALNDEHKEVTNPDARFIMGDALEFPLHAFLAACGEDRFSRLAFNPRGSFFLGTSLMEGTDSPPTSVAVHDNLRAMRFQLLLSAALGAFHDLDHVYLGSGEPCAPEDAPVLYARGLIYGATLLNPRGHYDYAIRRLRPGADPSAVARTWRLFTAGWGYAYEGPVSVDGSDWGTRPANLPLKTASANFPGSMPFTTGWSCSPTTLYLSYFSFNLYDYGNRSVATEWDESADSPLRRYFDSYDATGAADAFSLREDPQVQRDVSDVFGDLNVFAFSIPGNIRREGGRLVHPNPGGHEIAVVRLFPPERLLEEDACPTAGFLAAYHPLSGESCGPPPGPEGNRTGQLYVFEASGFLSGPEGAQVCGPGPFRWEPIPDNSMYVHLGHAANDQPGTDPHLRMSLSPLRLDEAPAPGNHAPRYINRFFRLKAGAPVTENYGRDAQYLPLVIQHPVASGGHWTSAAHPLPQDFHLIYAERAVPFPTMAEATGKFPTANLAFQLSNHFT